MTQHTVGILHPGNMGISIAASAQKGGSTVYWASEGRSSQTRERAEEHCLLDSGTMANLCALSSLIICVCPPDAALEIAREVVAHGFQGVYLDANAISPRRAMEIAQVVKGGGADFVDGGIIGGPAWNPGTTWLYLSGPRAEFVAARFSQGPLQTSVMGEEIGRASAIKMCYAAYTKGTTALLCAILAAAERLDVREQLIQQWSMEEWDLAERASERARRVTAKAWRFEGEMREISTTFVDAGMPGGFHEAAAAVYQRLAHFKDAPSTPSIESVLEALLTEPGPDGG